MTRSTVSFPCCIGSSCCRSKACIARLSRHLTGIRSLTTARRQSCDEYSGSPVLEDRRDTMITAHESVELGSPTYRREPTALYSVAISMFARCLRRQTTKRASSLSDAAAKCAKSKTLKEPSFPHLLHLRRDLGLRICNLDAECLRTGNDVDSLS